MKRLLATAFVTVSVLGLLAPAASAADQGQVTPGAFCTPEGDTGHTVTGLPMTCSRTATDSRLRWRQAGAAAPAAGGSGTAVVLNCGSASVGQTVTCDLSGLPANTAVTKFVNGTGGEQGTTNSAGTAHFSVQVLSQTAGVLGDPVNVTLQCGTNTLTASAGGTTSSGTFTLSCPAAVPAATPSSVAFTGANIALGSMGGSALVAGGSFLVWFSRRRRAA